MEKTIIKMYGIRVGDKFSENWIVDINLSNGKILSTKNMGKALLFNNKNSFNVYKESCEKVFSEISIYEFNSNQQELIMNYRKNQKNA